MNTNNSSIGQITPESLKDEDDDGAADEAETSFEETSQIEPGAVDVKPARSHAQPPSDEDLLDSARQSRNGGAPGSSN